MISFSTKYNYNYHHEYKGITLEFRLLGTKINEENNT